MNDTLASAPHQAGETPVEPAGILRQQHSLATLRSIIAAWDDRKRFRWEFEQMAKDNPHLIDDIGLTRRQVEAEIVKPFWRR
ncbi:DUF1127 domain-containing protein [Mesorhizobium sp.]|uniref:DUF1127 domain-containing protein n=1 Tax=Mesorhizobium sp. TaxID=1871066 RepID=UPI000FE39C01|nr:DUF1127 domain-containing protein [Mesorhizobium sp.]RWQ20516.1 MAG: DUF1127 domain-containing protein [Mesorhizobium sp.]